MSQSELPFPCGKQPDEPQFFNNRPIEINNWTLHLINAEELHSGNVVVLKKNNFNLVIDSGCNIAANIKKLTKKKLNQSEIQKHFLSTHMAILTIQAPMQFLLKMEPSWFRSGKPKR